jgi:CubicO group peptidase (beta-lactamase class C family)
MCVGAIAAAIACLVFCGGAPPPAAATAQDWLTAFNAGDVKALKALGDDSADFDADIREETGGLNLARIASNDGKTVRMLLRERVSPATWHVTLMRDAKKPERFSYIHRSADALPSEKDTIASVDAFATRLVHKDKFAGVLLVRKDGHDLSTKAYGTMDAAEKVPMTLDTKIFFASQGKMFTAVSIFQLIEKGRVSLNDTVGKFLPDYPNRTIAKKVTVRMLLAHTAGGGDMGILQPEDGANRARVHSLADIIALNDKRGPAFEPGTKWDYSNYDYILLGAIIEKASGISFYDYVQRNIFDRAGMTQTGYPLRENMTGIAIPMWPKDGKKLVSAMDMWPWRGTPAGGGVTTAGDEARFVDALNAGKLISKSSLSLATHAPGGFGFQPGNGFGLGFIESGVHNNKYWGHGGGAHGDSLALGYYPATHMTFVCMANREPPACDRIGMSFVFRLPRSK